MTTEEILLKADRFLPSFKINEAKQIIRAIDSCRLKKKSEQEVRDAITSQITRPFISYEIYGPMDNEPIINGKKTVLLRDEIQNLAVIIGKALGVIEEEKV